MKTKSWIQMMGREEAKKTMLWALAKGNTSLAEEIAAELNASR